MANTSIDDVMSTIERVRNEPLTPEEATEIRIWDSGRQLSDLVARPGWQVIKDMLADYVKNAVESVIKINPVEKEAVAAGHAIAYATSEVCGNLISDVERMVENSKNPPVAIKKQLNFSAPINLN